MALKKSEKEPKEKRERKPKEKAAKAPRISVKAFGRGKKAPETGGSEVVFGAVTPDTPEVSVPAYSPSLMPESDGFIAGVRSEEPVLSVNDSAAGAAWKRDLVPAIAGGALLMAFMSLFCAATWSADVIPFFIPGAVLFAALTMLGSIKPGKPRWIASGVIAVLLIASMAAMLGTIGGGLADLINEFYDAAEEAQAYLYRRLPGEGGSAELGAVWLSCLTGLLASLPPARARRITFYAIAMIAMFAFAYYGLVPSWICIAALLASLLVAVGRGSILSTLPLLLAVMLVFGAVVLIDPGENYGISRMDENFRDRFAFNSLLIQGPDTGLDDYSSIEDTSSPDDVEGSDDYSFENGFGMYTGIIIAVLIVIALAAAAYMLWKRIDKKRKANRAGIDSKDPREAVTAMFPYSVRWLRAGGTDIGASLFSELTPVVASEYSQDYANRYRDMYLLWRKAAYSDLGIEEADRSAMDGFVKDTAAMVKEKLTFTERIGALLKYAL